SNPVVAEGCQSGPEQMPHCVARFPAAAVAVRRIASQRSREDCGGSRVMGRPISYHRGRFPPADIDWRRLISLIGPTNAALARYDGLLTAIPNASILLSPLTTQEAVLSSRIEGTQATMGEVLEYEAAGMPDAVDPAKRHDIEEVLNYRR